MSRKLDRSNMTIARGSGTNAKALVTIDNLALMSQTPAAPPHLTGEAKQMFVTICDQLLEQGLLTRFDLPSVEIAAYHYDCYITARNQLLKDGAIVPDEQTGRMIPNPTRKVMDAELAIYSRMAKDIGLNARSRVEIEAIRLRSERLKISDADGIAGSVTVENLLGAF